DSKHAYQHKNVFKALRKADYIIITPGDLFTSIISNFVIGGVKEVIHKSDAKIIYIGNSTNKGGETQGLTHLDIIYKIERFLGKKINIFICNNRKLKLTIEQKQSFQGNISVKGGDYLYLSKGERDELERRKIKVYETSLIDEKTFYKHNKRALVDILEKIL
ncbi:2-phospho-L-lactate transferase CofD family protein, partial [Candidatus Gracilibacteria bacterium]|nr:2-phospho-L-lactate transferase CofD family protein [Candidatus Gracilibacteria bacterium]